MFLKCSSTLSAFIGTSFSKSNKSKMTSQEISIALVGTSTVLTRRDGTALGFPANTVTAQQVFRGVLSLLQGTVDTPHIPPSTQDAILLTIVRGATRDLDIFVLSCGGEVYGMAFVKIVTRVPAFWVNNDADDLEFWRDIMSMCARYVFWTYTRRGT